MLLLHPNWKARPIKIDRVLLTYEQVVQRRMFNQMRLVNMMPGVRGVSNRKVKAARIKLQILTSEVLRWDV